jgi:hypothetical protein
MQQFIQDSTFFADHASDADARKGSDPTEGPKHYIDLENIPAYENLTPNLDSLISIMGIGAVQSNGILPWATVAAFDSLVAQLGRGEWTSARLTASDLGHYVADAHNPLHTTNNYNGQLTGNYGIHSRYESRMINTYTGQLAVRPQSTIYIANPFAFVLEYCIEGNALVDSIMLADDEAKAVSAWSGSGSAPAQYYEVLWERTKALTLHQMQKATEALASLWYSAWIDAGLITASPSGAGMKVPNQYSLEQNYPNPFNPTTTIQFEVPQRGHVELVVHDLVGREVAVLIDQVLDAGDKRVKFSGAGLPSGVYLYRIRAGNFIESRKMILIR